MHETIVQFLNMSQFDTWITENPVLFVCIVALIGMSGYFFFPRVLFTYRRLKLMRQRWVWELLRGQRMSKRARNFELAEAIDDLLREWVVKGKLTHREKRRYSRGLEMALELEHGDLTPRPNVHERKRRTLGRLSADTANKFTEKMSAAAQPLKQRLSSLIAGKV